MDGVGGTSFVQYDDDLVSMSLCRLTSQTSPSEKNNFLLDFDLSNPFLSNVHDQFFVGSDLDDQFLIDLTKIAQGNHVVFVDGNSGNDSLNLIGSEIGFSTVRWMLKDGFGSVILNSSSCMICLIYRDIELLITDVQSKQQHVFIEESSFDYDLRSDASGQSVSLSKSSNIPKNKPAGYHQALVWTSQPSVFEFDFRRSNPNMQESRSISLVDLHLSSVRDFKVATSCGFTLQQQGFLEVSEFGSVHITSPVIKQDGLIRTAGGIVALDATYSGALEVTGKVDVTNSVVGYIGGNVRLLGKEIRLVSNSSINASGYSGGGTIFVGGGRMGGDVSMINSQSVFVGKQSSVMADSFGSGNGGEIIVWSDRFSFIHGRLSTCSFGLTGNGGFIETSSAGFINLDGISINSTTISGIRGSWLIDPYNIIITSPGNELPGTFIPSQENSRIDASDIVAALESGLNVTVSTGLSGSAGSQSGHIWIDEDLIVNLTVPAKLTLVAASDIYVNRSIIANTGLLSLEMNAGGSIIGGSGRITANDLNIHTSNDIVIRTSVNSLTATSSAGDISIDESDSLRIDRLEAVLGVNVTVGDAITIVSLATPQAVELRGRSVKTAGNGSIQADRLTIAAEQEVDVRTAIASLDARSSEGSITITETDSIRIDRLDAALGANVTVGDAITIVSLATLQAVELRGRSVKTIENGSIQADRLAIAAEQEVDVRTGVADLDARSSEGSVTVTETDSIRIDRLESALGANVRAVDAITVVSLATPQAAELRSRSVKSIENGSIQAERLTIAAEQEVDVRTAIASLDARSSEGSVTVTETDSIRIDRLEAALGASVTAGESITIVSRVTPQAAELRGRSVTTIENGSIQADRLTIAAEQDVDVRTAIASLDARSSEGSVTVTETDSIRIDRLESALGANVTAADAITIVSLVTPQGVELRGRSVKTIENGSIHADRLTIAAEQEVDVRTAIASLDARSSEGSITVTETDSLRIDRLEAALGASVTAGDAITIVSLVTPEQAELIAKTVMTGENGSITADRLLVDVHDNVSVKTTVGILDARNQMGSIEVVETDSIRIDRLDAALGTSVTAGDAINIDRQFASRTAIIKAPEVNVYGAILAERVTIEAVGDVYLYPAMIRANELTIRVNGQQRTIQQFRIDSRALTESDYDPLRFDANLDGYVSPLDVLVLIDLLNSSNPQLTQESHDINKDGILSVLDVLLIINHINEPHELLDVASPYAFTFFSDLNNDSIEDTLMYGQINDRAALFAFDGLLGELFAVWYDLP